MYKIKIIDFLNGFGLSQFHIELLQTMSAPKIASVSYDLTYVKINLLDALTSDEISEVNTTVANHVKIEKTDIELKSDELASTLDYHKSRNELKDLVTDFAILTDNEKTIVAKYCSTDDMSIIMYYMSQGLTGADAITKHKIRRAIDIDKAALSCRNRANSSVIKYISIKYLTEDGASSFLEATKTFMVDYREIALLGKDYNTSDSPREGIMDYIEATNSFISAGLSGYDINIPYTYDDCKNELKQFLVYGNRPIEFDEFSS